jgi:peptide/nickel transport system substrate-binding protein
VTGGPNLSFVAISVNTARKPFDDVRVRQALAWSIDRQAVGEKAFDGFAQPLFGPPLIPPFWAGSADQYYSKNVDKAKELLAEAGLPNGFKATLMTDTTSYHAGLATVAQAEWKNVGIDVEIQNIDSATAVDRWVKKDFDMYPIRWWGSDFIDPDGAFRPLFSCGASYNTVSFCSKELDDLLDQGVSVTDVNERKAIYADAMKLLADQQPWLFLVSFDRFQSMKSYVKGYVAFPNASQYSFREVWLDK